MVGHVPSTTALTSGQQETSIQEKHNLLGFDGFVVKHGRSAKTICGNGESFLETTASFAWLDSCLANHKPYRALLHRIQSSVLRLFHLMR